jgi:hypothetical protein
MMPSCKLPIKKEYMEYNVVGQGGSRARTRVPDPPYQTHNAGKLIIGLGRNCLKTDLNNNTTTKKK